MAILRMLGELPPDLESEVCRFAGGEAVKWSGRSSGFIEKFQGWALVVAGGIFALSNIGGPAAALGFLFDLIERGQTPGAGSLVSIGAGLARFLAGFALAIFGWRFLKSAEQVVWAITSRRFLRIIAGGEEKARAWLKRDILNVDRLGWTDPLRRCLAVRVRGDGDGDPVLIIVGPADLEAAEQALGELED
jgi:hypothetical protein